MVLLCARWKPGANQSIGICGRLRLQSATTSVARRQTTSVYTDSTELLTTKQQTPTADERTQHAKTRVCANGDGWCRLTSVLLAAVERTHFFLKKLHAKERDVSEHSAALAARTSLQGGSKKGRTRAKIFASVVSLEGGADASRISHYNRAARPWK